MIQTAKTGRDAGCSHLSMICDDLSHEETSPSSCLEHATKKSVVPLREEVNE